MLVVPVVLVALAGYGAAYTADDCPSGLPRNKYLQVRDDTCFQFVLDNKRDALSALRECEKFGGTMALVTSKEIQNYLIDFAKENKISDTLWIGLSDRTEENKFVWDDGTPINYSNWATGEGPRGGFLQHHIEDCVAIDFRSEGMWRDFMCHSYFWSVSKPYICQYQIQDLTTKPAATTKASNTTEQATTEGTTKEVIETEATTQGATTEEATTEATTVQETTPTPTEEATNAAPTTVSE